MKLIVQIPCFNEEKTLAQTLDDLPKSLPGVDEIEYLVINDGSSDETTRVAKEWGVNYIVNFTQNKGLEKLSNKKKAICDIKYQIITLCIKN